MFPQDGQGSDARISRLEQQVRTLRRLLAGAALVICGAVAWHSAAVSADDRADARVLRLRGLIIEDDHGRARIVLGAPTPATPGRKRADASTALVFLGEDGADRVCLGFTPNPQMKGKVVNRIAPAVGLQINDPAGNERAGFGHLANGRVVLGLDWPGREAIALGVDDKEGSAMMLMWGEKDDTPERAGFFAGRDGTTIMKVSDAMGFERFVFQTQGVDAARFLIGDSKDHKHTDVLPKLVAKP
ncbi:MAG: hypothetical protein U1A27_00755 [Phycisphaerae bacterium]